LDKIYFAIKNRNATTLKQRFMMWAIAVCSKRRLPSRLLTARAKRKASIGCCRSPAACLTWKLEMILLKIKPKRRQFFYAFSNDAPLPFTVSAVVLFLKQPCPSSASEEEHDHEDHLGTGAIWSYSFLNKIKQKSKHFSEFPLSFA
jgi:hypothetical protein